MTCCVNPSHHSESIHHSIQILKERFQKLQKEDDWFNGLFRNWNLSSWALSVIKTVLVIFVILVIVFVLLSCLLNCMSRVFQNSLPNVFAIEKKVADGVIGSTEIADIDLRPRQTRHCEDVNWHIPKEILFLVLVLNWFGTFGHKRSNALWDWTFALRYSLRIVNSNPWPCLWFLPVLG